MVTITLTGEEAAYLICVVQARHDAAMQRELHARSRGEPGFTDVEARLTASVVKALANGAGEAAGTLEWRDGQPLSTHPDYCHEHGGHLKDSPACEAAKLAALRAKLPEGFDKLGPLKK